MHRRYFLRILATTLLAAKTGISFSARTTSRLEVLPLWQRGVPGSGGPGGSMQISPSGAQWNISIPTLTVLSPAQPNGHGVLIAAGGGYRRIEVGKESMPAAQWLTARGYTAYILSYRLPGEGWSEGNRVSLQDALRALRLIRQREKQLSVLGFSAGGHLMGMAATRPDFPDYPDYDEWDKKPLTVDRAALIYPIITLEKPYTHTSTHHMLVGRDAPDSEDAAWSVQQYVTPYSPPFFLTQAENDSISNPQNTLIMAAACQRQHVPLELYRYPTGGHGFGMGRAGTATVEWPGHYETWLKQT